MFVVLLSLILLSAYLALGHLVGRRLVQSRFVEPEFIFIGSVAISCLLYMALFVVYLVSPTLGMVLNVILLLLGLIIVVSSIAKYIKKPVRAGHFLIPLFLCISYFCLFSVVLSTCRIDRTTAVANNNNFCHISNLPIDNSLPYLFADNVRNNRDSAVIIDWKLTDRPPLQIGVALSNFGFGIESIQTYKMYYTVSIFLQITCIGALYSFLCILKIRRRDIVLMVSAIALSSFVYINSVFVWPKLLSAGLMIAGMLQLIRHKSLKTRLLPTSALFIALSLLTHSGALFTLLGFAPVISYLIFKRYRSSQKMVNSRHLLISAGILLILLTPWQLYKNTQDSRDRLVKWHFAGIIDANDKKSNLEAIRFAYTSAGLGIIVKDKVENLKTLVKPVTTTKETGENVWSTVGRWLRLNSFFIALFAIGIMNLGWLTLLTKTYRKQISLLEYRTIAGSLISLLIWALMMFLPGSTIIHQGSYATILLLMVVGGVLISRVGSNAIVRIFMVQFILFMYVWVLYDYLTGATSFKNCISRFIFVVVSMVFARYIYSRKPLAIM